MERKNKRKCFVLSRWSFLIVAFFVSWIDCSAQDIPSHLIINELQITGGTGKTNNDFIELYNPTDKSINLKGYRLVKRTKTGSSDTTIKSWTDDTYIQSNDYHLWANSADGFATSLGADSSTSQAIADDNGIAIRNGPENSGEVIDSVGWGGCQNIFVEIGAFPQNIPAVNSIERQTFSDSDNNSFDFILKIIPTPTHSRPIMPDLPPPDPEPEPPAIPGPTPGSIVINEIMWAGSSTSESDEWLELKNTTEDELSLSSCHMIKKDRKDIVKNTDLKNKFIEGNNYFLLSYKDKDSSVINTATNKILSYQALSNSELELVLECDGKVIDTAGNRGAPLAGENGTTKKSMERIALSEDGTLTESWQTCYEAKNIDSDSIDCGTPMHENSQISPPGVYPKDIRFSELLPDPGGIDKEGEFIELFNFGEKDIDLVNWSIKDRKGNEFIMDSSYCTNRQAKGNCILASKKYFFIKSDDYASSGLTLDNAKGELVSLFDPNKDYLNPVTSASYPESRADHSFSFDERSLAWRWTTRLTPGRENEFDKALTGKIKIDKNIHTDVWASFSVSADKDAQKFTWDFGDSHRSYLKKTRHRYEKTGSYNASLRIRGNGAETTQYFTVEVKDFGKVKVRIIGLSANPKGTDSKGEYISIANNTKKKINLRGWSIATGWKTLYNHPINDDFVIKPGKTKKLTRKNSLFALANKQSRVELRYPDGRVADKIKYNLKDRSIAEDEIYKKGDKNWQWNNSPTAKTNRSSSPQKLEIGEQTPLFPTSEQNSISETEVHYQNMNEEDASGIIEAAFDISQEELENSIGKLSFNPDWQEKHKNQVLLLSAGSSVPPPGILLESQGRVLGTQSQRPNLSEKSTDQNLTGRIWKAINSFLNKLLFKILP